LRVLAFPFFLLFMLKTAIVFGEMQAAYCPPCRRQINACLFFGAAMLGIALLAWGVAVYLRSIGAR
jgi:hypothetical protein